MDKAFRLKIASAMPLMRLKRLKNLNGSKKFQQ